jgi:hypothetical protein
MSEYQQVERSVFCKLIHRDRAQASAFIARPICPARAGASVSKRARPVRVQRPEGFYGKTIPHDGTDQSISAIFFLSQPIAMVNPGIPSGDVAAPRSDVILDTDILAKNIVSPAIVVAGDKKDWQS